MDRQSNRGANGSRNNPPGGLPEALPHVHHPQVLRLMEEVRRGTGEASPGGGVGGDVGLPEPFFADAGRGVTLFQGSAFELLARLPEASFEVIFADPPYFLSGDGFTCQSGKRTSVKKGAWDQPTTFEAMHEFNREWLGLCRRLLTPDGTLWVTGTLHNIYSVGFALQTLGFKILNDIAWYKVNPPPNLACRYFTHATETVIWARRDSGSRHRFEYATMKAENGGKQMQSLWRIPPPTSWEKRFGKHPTQKPEALLLRILRACSGPGDRVLDPFCGSGTTGVACVRLGRSFVGIDQEADYLTLATRRMEEEQPVPGVILVLFLPTPKPAGRPATRWADRVTAALRDLGGEGHLREINRKIADGTAEPLPATWPCTVRRVVRESPRFQALGAGRYRLKEQMSLPL